MYFHKKGILFRLPDPRIIKTHLPLDMLPPRLIERCHRVVYVTRNPLVPKKNLNVKLSLLLYIWY